MATNEQIQIIIKAMAAQAVGELNKLDGALGKNQKSAGGLSDAMGKYAIVAAKVATVAATLYTVYTRLIKPASDLEEQINKFNVVFAGQADVAERAAETLVNSYGLSERAAREYMSTLGSMLKSMGMSVGESARMSSAMVQLGVDMSSFHNVDTDEVMTAFRSAISGEFEPMKRFGVLLNETTVKAEAMRMGLYAGVGAIDAQARAMAAMEIITRSQSDAMGDFSRTSGGLANQLRIAQANVENLSAKIGSALLPMATRMTSTFNTLVLGLGVVITKLADAAGQGTTTGRAISALGNAFATNLRASIAVATFSLSEFLLRLGEAEAANRRWQAGGGRGGVHGAVQGGSRNVLAGLRAAGVNPPPTGGGGGGAGARRREAAEAAAREAEAMQKINQQNRDRMVVATAEMNDRISGNNEAAFARLQQQYDRDIANATAHNASLTDIHAFYALERERLEEEMHQRNLQRTQEALSFVGTQWGQIGNIASQYFKNQSIGIDNWYKKKKASITNSTKDEETKQKEMEALEEQYEKKKRDAAIKQAKFEKANAIITATIQTANAVVNALAKSGPPWVGIAMASVVGALGAAQIAMIASQPIPAAAEGGLITGSQAGTLIRAGEGGRSEAIIPLENPEAMDRLGGMGGGTQVHLHFDRMWASTSMPQEVASAVDKALYDLRRRGNSRFATSIEG